MKRLLILLFVLLFATSAFATTDRIRYVDTDVPAGGAGDGSSWADAYATLALAEDAEDATGNISAATGSDENVIFYCRGTTADSYNSLIGISFNHWTTAPNNRIYVIGDFSGNNGSSIDVSKYRIRYTAITNGSDNYAITNLEDFFEVHNVQFEIFSNLTSGNMLAFRTSSLTSAINHTKFKNVYFQSDSASTKNIHFFSQYNGLANITLENVAGYIVSSSGVRRLVSVTGNNTVPVLGAFTLINCSFNDNASGGTGIGTACDDDGYTFSFYNCAFRADDAFNFTNGCIAAGTHNAISAAADAEAPATGLVVSIGSADARTEPKLRDAGLHTNWISRTKDDSGYPLNISHIYNGTVDIGAYEYFPRSAASYYYWYNWR